MRWSSTLRRVAAVLKGPALCLVHSVSESLDLDIGVKGGLTGPEADYGIMAGLTWRF